MENSSLEDFWFTCLLKVTKEGVFYGSGNGDIGRDISNVSETTKANRGRRGLVRGHVQGINVIHELTNDLPLTVTGYDVIGRPNQTKGRGEDPIFILRVYGYNRLAAVVL